MTRRPGWRGEKRWSRADAEKPDDTKTPEVAAGPKRCHGALAPLPNGWRQRRAKRVRCTPGLGSGALNDVTSSPATRAGDPRR
jgi:hypothetical protein